MELVEQWKQVGYLYQCVHVYRCKIKNMDPFFMCVRARGCIRQVSGVQKCKGKKYEVLVKRM